MKPTKRLSFRDLFPDDAEKLFAIYADKEAMKYRGSKINSIEDIHKMISDSNMVTKELLSIRMAIIEQKNHQIIGTILFKYSKAIPECTIGYSLGKTYWNNGFGTEIVKSMIQHINNKDIFTIKAWTHPENQGSIKILQKTGFKKIPQTEFKEALLFQHQTVIGN